MDMRLSNAKEYDDLVKPIVIATKIISIWPLDRESGKKAIILRNCHTAAMFFMVLSMSVATTTDVINTIDDLDEATECALICTAFYLCILRLTVYSLHRKDMLYIVETMQSDWVSASYDDVLILREKCIFTFRLAKYFISTVAITILLFICAPFVEGIIHGTNARVLPFRGYFFVNHTISPIFEIVYTYNVVSGCFSATTIAGATGFNLVVVMHGSAKFAILQRRLRAIKGTEKTAEADLAACIKSHQDAIAFADALERVINILALGQFVISTGLVCFAGFQITSMMEDRGRLMKYTAFLNSAILELFLFSFSGNVLIEESEAVGFAAYGSDWYGSNLGQTLQMIIMRCRLPCQITAAKFYSMSLESFATVLSTSFSYLTVLQATNEE
ncbi:hypothetical protein KPH14_006643 [Odynerus spinipes]|uniref:Odorant receptor n=1 Tax=Odynerus spinipes TaxID=1348599 RepID=A0AAD9RRW9_9HYME|nr:hypothetical protein KPH14_006643 [Odynerus spinipes]